MEIVYPNPNLMPHQLAVLKDQTRFKSLIWHRRARKTSTALEKVAMEAHNPNAKNKVYWVVFPTYAEAKEAVWKDPNMLQRVVPKGLIARSNEVELTIYLHSGSIISLKGADHPDSLRGAGPYGIVFDEFGTMKEEAWGVTEPILRANGGWAWFIGTPRGKNHLYKMYLRGQEGLKEWKSWLLKASTSGIVKKDQLREAKKSMNQGLYNQEWECDFLEGEGSVFRGVREVMTAKPQKPRRNSIYVIGCDLAKYRDYTVMAVYNRSTNAQVYQDRFKSVEWPIQKQRIKLLSEHFNDALVVLDATGLGDPICDDLLAAGVPVEPVKFTEMVKKELIEKLSIFIEQKRIRILPLEETKFEFDNFSYTLTNSGKIRYGALHDLHDDIVIAHSLAVRGLYEVYKEKKVIQKTPLQEYYARKTGKVQVAIGEDPLDAIDW